MKKTVLLAFVLVLLSTAIVVGFIRPVVAQGTIYIRADGSVDPPTAPISSVDNITYTFTGNIYDSIVVERNNIAVDGVGYTLQGTGSGKGIDLSGRSNITTKNMKIKAFDYGIYLYESSGNSISGNTITNNDDNGVVLLYSSSNSISANTITNNDHGMYLYDSSNNTISRNNTTNNRWDGIQFYSSSFNWVFENSITINKGGVRLLDFSNNNTISGNNIKNNEDGTWLWESSNNIISENSIIANNKYGIGLWDSSDNFIYHNNFVDNTKQVYSYNSTNVWDDGYPSGGNYWSDYTGVDSDHDGIGDTPYVINKNNQDNYPLMSPWGTEEVPEEEIPFWTQWRFWAIVAVVIVALAGAVYFLKKRKPPTPTAPPLPTEGTLQNNTQNTNPLKQRKSFLYFCKPRVFA